MRIARGTVHSIIIALSDSMPNPQPGLQAFSCFHLLVSAILSAQTTDAQVNRVTGALFERYPDAKMLASADQEDVERLIYSAGFYRAKARNIREASRILLENYNGEIPSEIDELVKIPGVGRKVANVIIGQCFGKPAIIVDTHFARVVKRVGMTDEKDPVKIEMAVKTLVPEQEQYRFSMLLYRHGQSVCKAKKPECESCVIKTYCRYFHDRWGI